MCNRTDRYDVIRELKKDLTWFKEMKNRTPEQELQMQQTLTALQRHYAGERPPTV